MNTLYYVLEANACLTILFLAYRIFLRNSELHNFNRYYLLLASTLSFILPVFNFSDHPEPPLSILPSAHGATAHPTPSPLHYSQWLLSLYFLGVLVSALHFIYKVYSLHRLSLRGKRVTIQGMTVVYIDGLRQPFSFSTSIFFP